MTTATFTAEQMSHLDGMDRSYRAGWEMYYRGVNEKALAGRIELEKRIRTQVRLGNAEPASVLRAVGAEKAEFDRAVRMMKMCGNLKIDGRGLMVAFA